MNQRAHSLAAQFAARPCETLEEALKDDVDAVIIAATNNQLAPLTIQAINAGKPVLVEKPAARTLAELDQVIAAADRAGVHVQPGFNHRYHPALQKAHEIFASGALGQMMFVRGRYGHGGRIGYDREWRADPNISGGGELLDQGVHLIDLARWFLGDFTKVAGTAHTYFWHMPVDDNGFLLLETETKQTAFLQVSCTEWKNMFSLEIYGRDGKLDIAGLGGSYGVERLTYYKMLPEMGPPETVSWEYPQADRSWDREIDAFVRTIEGEDCGAPTLRDARAALAVVETVYQGAGA